MSRDVLGVSDSNEALSLEVTYTDLAYCHLLNKIYLCERQGTLVKSDQSCLRALHFKDFPSAMWMCQFQVAPARDTVLQLRNNDLNPTFAEIRTPQDISPIPGSHY